MKSKIVYKDPEIMHGEACFKGTRMPVSLLFDELRDGSSIDQFLENYPGNISREMVIELLNEIQSELVGE